MADRDVVVLGVGLHPFGRHPEKSVEEMGRFAILEALDDAGISYGDVEAGFCGRVQGGSGTGLRVFSEVGMTGIPITNVELACASSSRAAMLAADQIQADIYDVALIVGVEKMQRGMLGGGGGGEPSYGQLMGYGIMPGAYAMMACRHMERYGTKPEHFAQVSVKSHANGALNPNAQYQTPVTLEEVMASRMIAEPITLLQSCPTTDGSAAVVLASERFARTYTTEFVHLRAWAGGSPVFSDDEALAEGPTTKLAHAVYERAGVGPEDVDVVQVHDAFAPGEVFAVEDLGLCAPGEGGPYVWEGETALGGRTPVNTDGGLLSRGHPMGATGCAMLVEQTRQLRGEAGARQVEGAKVALIHNQGVGGVNVLMMTR